LSALRGWLREGEPPDPKWLLESDFISDHFNYHLLSLHRKLPRMRAHFAWGMLNAAYLASRLAMPRFSVIEFGVAGGNGLVSLEQLAVEIEPLYNVGIDVFGFDTGDGLPPPKDYRDLPNLYRESGFRMDESRLRRRLTKAQLVIGDVATTLPEFIGRAPAPVGFVSIDVDLYSSTMATFGLFEAPCDRLLPRVYCYLDDILGETFCEFTGERLAVQEFNALHPMRKISPIHGLRHFLIEPDKSEAWPEQMFIAHLFDHQEYGRYAGTAKDAGGWTDLAADV